MHFSYFFLTFLIFVSLFHLARFFQIKQFTEKQIIEIIIKTIRSFLRCTKVPNVVEFYFFFFFFFFFFYQGMLTTGLSINDLFLSS